MIHLDRDPIQDSITIERHNPDLAAQCKQQSLSVIPSLPFPAPLVLFASDLPFPAVARARGAQPPVRLSRARHQAHPHPGPRSNRSRGDEANAPNIPETTQPRKPVLFLYVTKRPPLQPAVPTPRPPPNRVHNKSPSTGMSPSVKKKPTPTF